MLRSSFLVFREPELLHFGRVVGLSCFAQEMLVLSSNLADPAGVEGTFTAGARRGDAAAHAEG